MLLRRWGAAGDHFLFAYSDQIPAAQASCSRIVHRGCQIVDFDLTAREKNATQTTDCGRRRKNR